MQITPEQIRQDVYTAYGDAQKHKRNTIAQLNFEIATEINLEEIIESLINRSYEPLRSFCFITFDPVQREIFASQFRDRVVQHVLYNYLAPLFETLLIYDTYSCRVGKGTHFGIERFQHHLRSVTNNFTQEASVMFFDLSGYFMGIDKELLMKTIMDAIHKHYYHRSPDGRRWDERIDPDFCEFLIHCFLSRNPADNAIIIGSKHDWDGLPNKKRLGKSPKGIGIVIGDITSQLFSNILLNITDQWAKRIIKLRHWGHYVDDHYIMHPDGKYLRSLKPIIEEGFQKLIHVTVHPQKYRFSKATENNQFLGACITPFYTLPSTRTIRRFTKAALEMEYDMIFHEQHPLSLETTRARINSYCGTMSHYSSYNLLKNYLYRPAFTFYYDFEPWLRKCNVKPEFVLRQFSIV